MPKLSRRETLARGGRAIAAAAVLSTLPSVAHTKEDAELFALYEKCKQLEKEYMAAINRYEKVWFPVRQRHEEWWRSGGPIKRYSWCRGFSTRTDVKPQLIKEARAEADRIYEEEWVAKLAKAGKRAGVPALKKKHEATERAWLDAVHRFYDMPAHTFEGMILKLTNEWTDRMWRAWRAKDGSEHFEIHPDATPSILMDLERLAGRRI